MSPCRCGLIAEPLNDMGVCDAIEQFGPAREPGNMSTPPVPKVAGTHSPASVSAQNVSPEIQSAAEEPALPAPAALQDRLAGWVSDLTTLHELTERLSRARTMDEALREVVRAGGALVGARRGLVRLEPAPAGAYQTAPAQAATAATPSPAPSAGSGPARPRCRTFGLGLDRSQLGRLETVPRESSSYGRIMDALPGAEQALAQPDLFSGLPGDPRCLEVARTLGFAASYAVPLLAEPGRRLGAAVWLYDEPAAPTERQCHLVGLYLRYAGEHLARLDELGAAVEDAETLRGQLRSGVLPQVPGIRLAGRYRSGSRGGGGWYDALPLTDGALGLAVGTVTGSGGEATAAMARLRAALRSYAVLEGEDPVAVLSDLELLLRLTEPSRSATALFAHCASGARKLVLAGAGHAPPLLLGPRRVEYVESTLSAPLGMLSCWEAPSVEIRPEPGEAVVLYTDGLLRATGDPMDRAFARLHAAAAAATVSCRLDPSALAEHLLDSLLPEGVPVDEDIALLTVCFT